MDYTQFLSMTEELSLLAVIVILFLADLFLCGKDEKELSACTADGASLSSCGCNFRTAFPVILLLVHTALNLLPCCNGSLEPASAFGGMYQHTPMMTIVKSVLNIGVIVVFLMSSKWLNSAENRIKMGEFHTVVLFTLLGMYFMISSGHFIMFFIGLELASIPMAALVAYDKKSQESAEAGGKFILLALFSSALLLYGISLIYGVTGTLYFDEIGSRLSLNLLSILGLVLFISGMGFKISLVPFHLWTADTYEGAPTVVTGYLSVISKGSAAFVLMTILVKLFGAEAFQGMWSVGFFWIILASITIANLFAIRQKNLKRFMAFSAISQAGYLVLGIMGGTSQGMTALVFYLFVSPVCRLLLEVLHLHGSLQRWIPPARVLGIGQHHHLVVLLLAHCQGHVHQPQRAAHRQLQERLRHACRPRHLHGRRNPARHCQRGLQLHRRIQLRTLIHSRQNPYKEEIPVAIWQRGFFYVGGLLIPNTWQNTQRYK